MKKLLSVGLLLGLVSTAFAQTNTSTFAQVYNQLKESPLSLTLDEGIESTRDSELKLNGVNNIHEFYVLYKFSDKDSLRLYHRFDTPFLIDKVDIQDHFLTDSTELRYKRNLFTEKDFGYLVSTEARMIHLNNKNDYINQYNFRLNVDKNLTDKLSLSTILRYEIYQHAPGYKRSEQKLAEARAINPEAQFDPVAHRDVKNTRIRVYVAPAYSFSDKLAVSTMVRYSYNFRKKGVTDYDYRAYANLHWFINKSFRVDLYTEGTVAVSTDKRDVFMEDIFDYNVYGLRLSMRVF